MKKNKVINPVTGKKIKKVNSKVKKVFTFIFLSAFGFIQVFPLYWMFMFSLKTNADILLSKNVLGPPVNYQWEHYVTVLTRSSIPKYFLNSFIYTGATVLIVGVIATMASYGLTRLRWKWANVIFMVFVVGITIPGHAALLPLFQVINATGLRSVPYVGMIIIYVASAIPMSVMILTSFFKSIPKELEEAAFIDGCTIYGSFWRIMVPLVMPALATASIFTMMNTWNELMMIQTFVDVASLKTITVGVFDFVGQHQSKLGLIGAGLVAATIPVIVIYIIFSEKIQQSLLQGAIKG